MNLTLGLSIGIRDQMSPKVDPTVSPASQAMTMTDVETNLARLNQLTADLQKSTAEQVSQVRVELVEQGSQIRGEISKLTETIFQHMNRIFQHMTPEVVIIPSSSVQHPTPAAPVKGRSHGISPLPQISVPFQSLETPELQHIHMARSETEPEKMNILDPLPVSRDSAVLDVYESETPSERMKKQLGDGKNLDPSLGKFVEQLVSDENQNTPIVETTGNTMSNQIIRYRRTPLKLSHHKVRFKTRKRRSQRSTSDCKASISFPKNFRSVNTFGMKRWHDREKRAKRHVMMQALKSYGISFSFPSVRNRVEHRRIKFGKRSVVNTCIRNHLFDYGFQAHELIHTKRVINEEIPRRLLKVNSIGMKRRYGRDKKATRREFLQALKTYGMSCGSASLRNREVDKQILSRRKLLVEKGTKYMSHFFGYGLQSCDHVDRDSLRVDGMTLVEDENMHELDPSIMKGDARKTKPERSYVVRGGCKFQEPMHCFDESMLLEKNSLNCWEEFKRMIQQEVEKLKRVRVQVSMNQNHYHAAEVSPEAKKIYSSEKKHVFRTGKLLYDSSLTRVWEPGGTQPKQVKWVLLVILEMLFLYEKETQTWIVNEGFKLKETSFCDQEAWMELEIYGRQNMKLRLLLVNQRLEMHTFLCSSKLLIGSKTRSFPYEYIGNIIKVILRGTNMSEGISKDDQQLEPLTYGLVSEAVTKLKAPRVKVSEEFDLPLLPAMGKGISCDKEKVLTRAVQMLLRGQRRERLKQIRRNWSNKVVAVTMEKQIARKLKASKLADSLAAVAGARDGNEYLINLLVSPEPDDFASEVGVALRNINGFLVGLHTRWNFVELGHDYEEAIKKLKLHCNVSVDRQRLSNLYEVGFGMCVQKVLSTAGELHLVIVSDVLSFLICFGVQNTRLKIDCKFSKKLKNVGGDHYGYSSVVRVTWDPGRVMGFLHMIHGTELLIILYANKEEKLKRISQMSQEGLEPNHINTRLMVITVGWIKKELAAKAENYKRQDRWELPRRHKRHASNVWVQWKEEPPDKVSWKLKALSSNFQLEDKLVLHGESIDKSLNGLSRLVKGLMAH